MNATIDELSTDQELTFYAAMRVTVGFVLYPIVCIFTISANAISIVVLCKSRKSATYAFLGFILISDLLHAINDLSYSVCMFFEQFGDRLASVQVIDAIYPYSIFTHNATMACTAWVTIAVAIERYKCMSAQIPNRTGMCTYVRAICLCLATAFISAIISLPFGANIFQFKPIDSNLSMVDEAKYFPFGNIYNMFFYILRAILPIIVLIILSIMIFTRLETLHSKRGKKKTIVQLILAIVLFITCALPDIIITTVVRFLDAGYVLQGIAELTNFLLLLHCSFDTILYCGCNVNFQRHFKIVFNCFKKRNKKVPKSGQKRVPKSRRKKPDLLREQGNSALSSIVLPVTRHSCL